MEGVRHDERTRVRAHVAQRAQHACDVGVSAGHHDEIAAIHRGNRDLSTRTGDCFLRTRLADRHADHPPAGAECLHQTAALGDNADAVSDVEDPGHARRGVSPTL